MSQSRIPDRTNVPAGQNKPVAIGRPPFRRPADVTQQFGEEPGEIASLLDISVGTSKAQLFRARRLLREALGS